MPHPPTPVAPPPRTRTRNQKDQGTLDPTFPTQATAMSTNIVFSQGERRGPYPTMVQRVAGLLRKPQELMKRQREYFHLMENIQDLDSGGIGGGICNQRRWTSLVQTSRFHSMLGYSPLPGTRHSGSCLHQCDQEASRIAVIVWGTPPST